MIPGEIIVAVDATPLAANLNLAMITLTVANTGDRPIQVGSHYHFFETNEALRFERAASRGFRLNIPAGTAVRFEAGDTLIHYRERQTNFISFDPVTGAPSLIPFTLRSETRHNFQFVAGIGWRF